MNYDSINGVYYGMNGEIVPESAELYAGLHSVTGGNVFENLIKDLPLIMTAMKFLPLLGLGSAAGAVSAPNAGAVRAPNSGAVSAPNAGGNFWSDRGGYPCEFRTPHAEPQSARSSSQAMVPSQAAIAASASGRRPFLFNSYQTKKDAAKPKRR